MATSIRHPNNMKRHVRFPAPRNCANVHQGRLLTDVDAFNNAAQCSLLSSKNNSEVQEHPTLDANKTSCTGPFDSSISMPSPPNRRSTDRSSGSSFHKVAFAGPEIGLTSFKGHTKKHHPEQLLPGDGTSIMKQSHPTSMKGVTRRHSEELDKVIKLGQRSLFKPSKAGASPLEKSKKDMMDAFSPEFSRGLLNMPSFGDSRSFNDDMVVDFTSQDRKGDSKLFTQMKPVRGGRRSSWHCDDKLVVQTVCSVSEDSEGAKEKGMGAELEFVVGGEVKSAVSWIKSPPISRPTISGSNHHQDSLFASNINLNILDELAALPAVEANKCEPRRCTIDMPSFSDCMSLDGMGLPMDLDDEDDDKEQLGRNRGSCWNNVMKPRLSDDADKDLLHPRLHTVQSGEEMDETMASLFAATGFAPRLAGPPPAPPIPDGAEPYTQGRSESVTAEEAMAAAREVGAFWERYQRQGSFTSRGSFASRGSFTSISRSGHARQSGSLRRRSLSRNNSFALDEALRITEAWGGPTALGRSESVTTQEAASAARDVGASFQCSRSSILSRQESVATMATVHSDGSCGSTSDDDEKFLTEESKLETTTTSSDKIEIDMHHADFHKSPSDMFASPEPNEGQVMMGDVVAAAIQAAAGAVKDAPTQDALPKIESKRRGAISRSEFQVSPGRTEQDYITPDTNRTIISGFGESRQQNLFLPRLSNGSKMVNGAKEKKAWTSKSQKTMLPSCYTDETQDSSESDDINEISEELKAFDV